MAKMLFNMTIIKMLYLNMTIIKMLYSALWNMTLFCFILVFPCIGGLLEWNLLTLFLDME